MALHRYSGRMARQAEICGALDRGTFTLHEGRRWENDVDVEN